MGTTSTAPSRPPTRSASSRVRWLAVAACGVSLLTAASCASDSKASTASTRPPDQAPVTTVAAAAAGPSDADGVSLTGVAEVVDAPNDAATNDSAASVDPSSFGSALAIETAVTLEVPDVRAAVADLPDIVGAHEGAIFDTDIEIGNIATARATVTVKVRPADLEGLIKGLAGMGTLQGRTQQVENVSTQITDVGARIETAQASVDRVRQLLADATDLAAIVSIESELTVRETALEQLLASQRNLTDRVKLATLTVTMTPAPTPIAAVVEVPKDSSGTSIGHALRTGWDAFTGVVHGLVVAVAYGGPFLLIAAIASVLGLMVARRRRRNGTSTSFPAPTAP